MNNENNSNSQKVWKISNWTIEFPSNYSGIVEWPNGTKEWFLNGEFHRTDGPAIEFANGSKAWYLNGKRHRTDGPAIENANGTKEWWWNGKQLKQEEFIKNNEIENNNNSQKTLKVSDEEEIPQNYTGIIEWKNGSKFWYLNGKRHRTDGPAVKRWNGDKEWWINGELHRTDGPAVEEVNGSKFWYLNGKRHRTDGPAREWSNGSKEWWINGERHRTDGPAIEWVNGYKEWWLNGKQLKQEEYMKNNEIENNNNSQKVLKVSHWTEIPENYSGIVEDADGNKAWYLNGKWHRTDGPAIEWVNGYKEWWLNGKQLKQEEFIKNNEIENNNNSQKVLKVSHWTEIPENYTGIVEYFNGSKTWYLNGKLHRTDGPAVERVDSSKEWYLNGKHHRTDGPAIELHNGTKVWYLNGEFHRTDGPAVEEADGSKEWYLNGKRHRTDGPAIENANGTKEWWWNGKQLKQEEFIKNNEIENNNNSQKVLKILNMNEIPENYTGIIEWPSGSKEWRINGKHHRTDGPAVEWSNGYKEWYLNGKLHRTDGPAVERVDGNKAWYLNGLLHRTDGPAVEYVNGYKEWHFNGLFHRTDGPAVEYVNGDKAWYLNGKRHRIDGPAVEWSDGYKEWWLNGKQLKQEEFIKNNEIENNNNNNSQKVLKVSHWTEIPENYSGIVEYFNGSKTWYLNGKPHRTDGSAIEYVNGDKHWFLNGKRHRIDGPAVEDVNGFKEWWINGERHRTDGPAVEHRSGYKEWWLNGKQLKQEEFIKNNKIENNNNSQKVLKISNFTEISVNYSGIVELPNGTKYWYLNGELHRTDGPAVEDPNGYKAWYLNGEIHRTDGPAREFTDGHKEWWVNGKLQRTDKSVVENANEIKEWFLNGKQLKQEEYMKNNEIENNNSQKVLKISHWTEIPENYSGIVEYFNGSKWWYLNGKPHKTDGPAREWPDGSKEWYLNGKLHRTDGPAREYADGFKAWLLNGLLHRTDGPAVEQADGYKEWYLNGNLHRTDGPAVEDANGFKAWWINGKRHKVDGPAIEYANGSKEWWENGFLYRTDGYENQLLETNKQMNKKLFANNKEKLVDDKKIQNAPKKVYTSITDTKLKNSSLKEKNMEKEKGIIQTLKDDSSLVAKRVATRKVVNVARDLLVSMMSVGKTKKEINNIKNTLGLILQSDDGKAILSFIIGAMLPFILVQLPEKYHDIAKDMAQEFRVEGIAHFGTIFADFVTGSAFQTAKTLIINALDEVADTKEEKVRVASDLNNKSKNDQIDYVEEIKSNEKRNDYAG